MREKSEKIKIWKIEKAEKNYVNFCDLCGWELVCTTPSDDPILCFNQVM